MKSTAGGPQGSKRTYWKSHSALFGVAAAAISAMAVSPTAAQEAGEDVIVVTGSRIVQPDYEFSNPVVSLSQETIQQAGATNITDFLIDLPSLVNSFDAEESADTEIGSSAGLNLLNLRNLGVDRTLVLVDGRRHVGSDPGSAAVDVNTIPLDLIERVEVLTGGASAIYGADGVSGVVNFVMKDDFEGLRVRGQTGWSEDGGGDNSFISLTAGTNFAEGRGNFTFAYELSNTTAVNSSDRDYARPGNREVLIENPADAADDPSVPDFIFARDIRYFDTSPGGSVYTDFDFGDSLSGVDFTGDGNAWVDGVQTGDFTMQGGSGSLLDQFVDQMLPGQDRQSANALFHYDLNRNHTFFAEAKWSQTKTQFQAQPTYDFFLFVPIDNPYIPTSIVNDALLPGNIGDAFGGVFVARDNFDLGFNTHDITRDTYRTVIGLEGTVTEGMDYQVSMVWGRAETQDIYRTRNNERWFAAIDAVDDGAGNIVCRSDFDGSIPDGADPGSFGATFTPGAGQCVPVNIFGPNVSDAARDWIMTDLKTESAISQFVLQAYLTGDSARLFELPAGPIGYAVGMEYREEESEYRTSDLEALAADLGYDITWASEGTDSGGRFDVFELFGEVEVPVLKDLPFIQEFTIDAAYRYSDYSSIGDANTWKFGATWRLNDMLMFRSTTARAVRAPNITELYLPNSQTFAELNDPCDDNQVNLGTGFRYANCVAALTALNAINPAVPTDPLLFNNTTSTSIPGRTGGNADLDAETSDTFTYGFVFSPGFIEGLTVSLDYYDIELKEAIQTFDAQTIVDYCYDLPQPNQYCDFVQRTAAGDPSLSVPAGGINGFSTQYVNVAQYIAAGYDLSVRYALDPANFGLRRYIGEFQLQLNATKLDELTFIESPLAEIDNDVGDVDTPKWQAVLDITWTYRDFTFNYGLSWFDDTRRVSDNTLAAEPDYLPAGYETYKPREVHDIYAAYDFNEQFRLYGGVNNVGDEQPERGNLSYPVGPLGRFFYVGASASFASIGSLLSGD